MTSPKQNVGLQIIFSIFLGLMVAAFVGVGVYTFYPPAEQKYQDELQKLYREQEGIQNFKDPAKLTDADRAQLKVIQDKINSLQDKQTAEREVWGRFTSIILISFATLVMAISLIRAEQLPVISNGLLLGGVFTMLYGVGWIIATGTSYARFIVMAVALTITLGLGYARFVRSRAVKVESGGSSTESADLGDLPQRVQALEKRLDAAASALGEAERR